MPTDPAYGFNPVSEFEQEAGQGQGGLAQILGQLESSAAPQVAISELQAALAGNQYTAAGQQYGLTGLNLEQNAANQLAQLGISEQQLGLQGQGLAAQAGLLGTTSGLEQAEYGWQSTQYPEQQAEAKLNYQNNQQNLLGNLAASGATDTRGSQSQQNLLSKDYQYQQQDIQRAQTEAYFQQLGTLAQQKYSAGDIARQQENLGLVAAANGLSVQEVKQQLAYGLGQAGLDYAQAGPQLLGSLSSIWSGELSAVEGAAGQAGLLSGLSGIGSNSGINLFAPGVQGIG